MKINYLISKCSKAVAILVVLAISYGAFATLGDGNSKKKGGANKALLSIKGPSKPGMFSLRSGYQFRGSRVINTEQEKYINLNTFVTYQQGHTTYIMPLKKKVALNGKVTFNPNAATRN
jgi:hypothetical protein